MRRFIAVGIATAGVALTAAGTAPAALVSNTSPFEPACNGAPQSGIENRNSEVEPWVDVNPMSLADADGADLIAVYQQDRFSSGGSNGLGTSVSTDGGLTWSRLGVGELPQFSRCAGGLPNSPYDYERASDPWVSFDKDGKAYQVSISFNDTRNFNNAVEASTSTKGSNNYRTWTTPAILQPDTSNRVFNDKESVTGDRLVGGSAYAIWDRLIFPNDNPRGRGKSFENAAAYRGPTWFSKTTNGGKSWQTRQIFDPGQQDQTIGNQIVVMSNGDLVDGFELLRNDNKGQNRGGSVAVIRSTDKGEHWTQTPVIVDKHAAAGVTDPFDGRRVRTGDIIPEIAEDPRPGSDTVYMTWQDTTASTPYDQVLMAKSTNGGRSWSAPIRVNHNTVVQAFTPNLHVAANGDVGLVYYDFTSDNSQTRPLNTDTWFRSLKEGDPFTEASFSDAQSLHPTFDMRVAPYARGHFVGDYMGLTSAGSVFTAVFDAANPGTESPVPGQNGAPTTGVDPQNRTDTFSTNVTP